MQSHENDLLISPESHVAPAKRKDAAESAGPEALMQGRTDVLTRPRDAPPEDGRQRQRQRRPRGAGASLVKKRRRSGGGSPLDRTPAVSWSLGWAPTSATSGSTPMERQPSRRAQSRHTPTRSAMMSFSSPISFAHDSDPGQRMLAHELTHVVQQRSGPVAGTPAPGGIQISNPSDSFEQAAESSADRVMSSSAPSTESVAAAPAAVQRGGAEGEEEDEARHPPRHMPSSVKSRKSCRKTKGSDKTDWLGRVSLSRGSGNTVRTLIRTTIRPSFIYSRWVARHQVTHVKRAVSFGGCIGCGHRDVADRAARKLERFGEEIQVEVVGSRHGAPKASLP